MLNQPAYNTITRVFGPGETIEAVIRLCNDHTLTKEELDGLVYVYNKINKHQVPKLSNQVNIPILIRDY